MNARTAAEPAATRRGVAGSRSRGVAEEEHIIAVQRAVDARGAAAQKGPVALRQPEQMLAGMHHLGSPAYFVGILGMWKLLGVAAMVAPGQPRLTEWGYAGFAFDLSGAAASHLVRGDGLGKALVPPVLLAIGLTAWALRPASRRL